MKERVEFKAPHTRRPPSPEEAMQKAQIPVKEIVRQYIIKHGYDGLYSDLLECGCSLDDLMPCDCNPYECCPGYKVRDPSGEVEFLIASERGDLS